jgi:Trk-type K+ transport system membrane component
MENQPTSIYNNFSHDVSGLKEFPKTTALIWIVVLLVCCFLIVALNLATFLTFLLNRHLRIRSLYCLINQALADASFTTCSGSFYFFYAGVKIFDFDSDKQTLQVTSTLPPSHS